MKKKIRVLIPLLISEILEQDCTAFQISKEKLCNQILLKFSLRFRSNYQNELDFEAKEYLQFNLSKENQIYYSEIIKHVSDMTDSDIIREIFLNYAVLYPALREIYLYREKLVFLNTAMKEYRVLKIDTGVLGIVEGRIQKIFRDSKSGYLKLLINNNEYYMSLIRIIN